MKLGKIGVRFTLQQSFGFDIVSLDKDGKDEQSIIDKFPVYAQVTYKRKNTKFKIGNEEYTKDEFLSDKTKILLEQVESKIKNIIELEASLRGNEFSLKGFGKRFEKYDETVSYGTAHITHSLIFNRATSISEDQIINGKEMFFGLAFMGSKLVFDIGTKDEKKRFFECLINMEQIGNMLLDRNHLNFIFTDDVKDALNTFISIFENKHDNISIYNWLQDSLNNKQNNYTNKVNELLWRYLIE
ncbi:MAG: hypothetical protein K9J13_05650 [Saprospiraceae bacterium]|nr:hypothetical protein [Saprospiraceae bacterium]